MAKQPNNDAKSAGLLTIADERKVVANLLTTYKKIEECAHPKLSRTDTFCCDLCLAAPMCDAMSAVIDARKLFGSLQLEARTRRFKTEVAAFERQCSDRARNVVDMFEAVAWARQHPASAMHFMLAMKDDAPDQVLVGRLARILYGRRRAKTENRLTAEAPFPPPVERVEPAEPDSGFGSDIA